VSRVGVEGDWTKRAIHSRKKGKFALVYFDEKKKKIVDRLNNELRLLKEKRNAAGGGLKTATRRGGTIVFDWKTGGPGGGKRSPFRNWDFLVTSEKS